MNRNFLDMLIALSEESAEFMIVGAFAVSHHGFPRYTGDIDIWIKPSPENAQKVWNALRRFGAPTRGLELKDLTEVDLVYQIGIAPQRIDLLTSITGLQWDEAWPHRTHAKFNDRAFPLIGKEDLIKNKRAAGRPKDLIDAHWLESGEMT